MRTLKGPEMTKRSLLLSEERLKMVLEGSELGFWDWNIESGEVRRNERWAQMLGYSTIQDFEDNTDTWTDSIHPEDRDAAWASINDHKEGRTNSHKMEYRMLTKNDGHIWIQDQAKVVERDINGRPLRMSGTHSDISARKKLETERDNLIKSLQKAFGEIKTLKGLISICSYCHNIRNDDGAWSRIEAYISQHSEASFTHGICPTCAIKVRVKAGLDEK